MNLLLDCGPGALHRLAQFRLAWTEISHVALSHFHTDHVADLPALLFALRYASTVQRQQPLTLLGPQGTELFLNRLAAAYGDFMLDPGFPMQVIELQPGAEAGLGGGMTLSAWPTPHTTNSLALRIAGDDRVVAYTGDTGPDEALSAFLRGADLLIAECSLPDRLATPTHLSPSTLAAMAINALPRRLLVTHIFPQLCANEVPDLLRGAGWNGPVLIATDGMRIAVADP